MGYQFYTREGDFSVELHIKAFPPDCTFEVNSTMEFWITVNKTISPSFADFIHFCGLGWLHVQMTELFIRERKGKGYLWKSNVLS
jgi:hypothetical protein